MNGQQHPPRLLHLAWVLLLAASWTGRTIAQEAEPSPAQSTETTTPTNEESAQASLEERIRDLESNLAAMAEQMEQERLAGSLREAEHKAETLRQPARPEEGDTDEGGSTHQAQGPEISVTVDILATLVINQDRWYVSGSDRSSILVRELGIGFTHEFDPHSRFMSILAINPQTGFVVEEVYASWTGLIPSVTLSLGRFRQDMGAVNRSHLHDLDQTHYPLALALTLGQGGLVGDGFSVSWHLPKRGSGDSKIHLEVVDGSNETLFAGEHFSIPSSLLRLESRLGSSNGTSLELGLTGMFGFNNARGLITENHELIDEAWRRTVVGGADLTLSRSPRTRFGHRSFLWRSEGYYVYKELAPDEEARHRHSWGAYSYLQQQFASRLFVGVRGDLVLPTERVSKELAWDVVPYVTFWQKESIYLRLEYSHGRGIPYFKPDDTPGRRTDNRVMLQVDFAAGHHD